jgi:hypothetical protein
MQIYTRFANFTGLYFPHFTTIRNQTLQFYSFLRYSFQLWQYGIGFRSSCLDQNFVYSSNHLLKALFSRHDLGINVFPSWQISAGQNRLAHKTHVFSSMNSTILAFQTGCTVEVCKSDPKPIRSDSFGFRNQNIHFGSIGSAW